MEPGLRVTAGADKLDRDAPIELGIVGGINDSHSARANGFEENVATDQRAGREVRSATRVALHSRPRSTGPHRRGCRVLRPRRAVEGRSRLLGTRSVVAIPAI